MCSVVVAMGYARGYPWYISRAVCTMLKPIAASMDDDQKSELSHDIYAVPWFDIKEGNAVQTVLHEGSQGKQNVRRKRRCMQDLMAFASSRHRS